jgi:FkbM family methyltransferase
MAFSQNIMGAYRDFWNRRIARKILKNWGIVLSHKLSSDDSEILKEIFCNRIYADHFPFYQKCTVVDIGAHKGFFSLFAYLNVNPGSHILAFEPATHNFQVLQKNLKLNNVNNIDTYRIGIGARRCKQNLHLTKEKNYSIMSDYPKILNEPIKDSEEIDIISLEDLVLDSQLDKIDFMKMDCEGAEYESLFNAKKEILSRVKAISVELHDLRDPDLNGFKLAKYLQKNEFSITRYSFLSTVSKIHVAHLVAIRNER